MFEGFYAPDDLPYQGFVRWALPYRKRLLLAVVVGYGSSAWLAGFDGTTDLWKGIPGVLSFILWIFYCVIFWFDPVEGPFVRPARLADPPPRMSPWLLAAMVPIFLVAGTGGLIFLIVACFW